jgi:hypothetical protein
MYSTKRHVDDLKKLVTESNGLLLLAAAPIQYDTTFLLPQKVAG